MRGRVVGAKRCTARVFVDGEAVGSGFCAGNPGLVFTCYHVVQRIIPQAGGQANPGYAVNIEVEPSGAARVPATVHPSCTGPGLALAIANDYAVLQVTPASMTPAPLGRWADVDEGAAIYLAGFPLGISQPVVATGILSTKWQASAILIQGANRQVAWLDISINPGNSGGPVFLKGSTPQDDRVIGIATFGLNPFADAAEAVAAVARNFPGGATLMGVNFGQFVQLVGAAISTNSVGVGGCVSIDYARSAANV